MTSMVGHAYSQIRHSLASFAMVSKFRPRRLVVFVHGWRGNASTTWGDFVAPPPDRLWWSEADLLFVEYDSVNEHVTAASDRLRAKLEDFYPVPHLDMLVRDGIQVRNDITTPYEELILVGHSLGGLVLRRAMVDSLDEWRMAGYPVATRPSILDGSLRFFSPASAGFSPSGALGALNSAPMWWVVEMFLNHGSGYKDLQPGGSIIVNTRRRTEAYSHSAEHRRSVAANILWANPEKVVATERYDTDILTRTADGTSHRSVYKPSTGYSIPFRFVEIGDVT